LLAICDRWDLGGISYAHHPQLDRPAVFIYDGWPGGVGLARTGYERAEELLVQTRDLLAACPCEDGCPACVHSPKCGSGNQPLDKAGARVLLELLTGVRALDAPAEAAEEVRKATAAHRAVIHAGVRGGGSLPVDFFAPGPGEDGSVSAAGPPDVEQGPRVVGLDEAGWSWDFPGPGDLLAPGEGRWLFFDVETLRGADEVGGWGNIRDMGLALAVVLDGATGEFRTYFEQESENLVEDLLRADRVVGFNQDRFDLTVLAAYAGDKVRRVRSFDLLTALYKRLGFRLSLSHLAQETLGAPKLGDGLQSLRWVKEGRLDLVEKYCRHDVLLTAALWAHGRSRGYVVFRDRTGLRGRIPVKW
jgi:DEAD/DEAH box helicase domain-containing protein